MSLASFTPGATRPPPHGPARPGLSRAGDDPGALSGMAAASAYGGTETAIDAFTRA
ncbi:hypothetical protein ABZ860_24270 [Microbispora sp. NPDC046973]|uniref:hypothetical protein n=1 Tax=Microbispora sp. NPDC046973 TaxID=3155022 RepID=UPI0033C523FD